MSAPDYAEYPITLSHPHFKPSVSVGVPGTEIVDQSTGQITGYRSYHGSPLKYPPVTVNTQQDEDYYISQGYERAGKIDPSAWVRHHADAPPEDYKPQKYPMWKDGKLISCAQDDPDATEEDLNPPETAEAAPAPRQAQIDAMAENALKAADELARTKDAQLAAQTAENEALLKRIAELEAMKDKRSASRKPAQSDAVPA